MFEPAKESSRHGIAIHLLQNVAGIVDDAQPAVVRAVGDGLFLGAGVGKNEVAMTPIVGGCRAPGESNPRCYAVETQRGGSFRGRGLFLQWSFLP